MADTALRRELAELINRHSREGGSNTPDFILAGFLLDCLGAFDRATRRRAAWYGGRGPVVDDPTARGVIEGTGDDG